MGIRTIGDLARTEETLLVRKLGKMGSILWAFANGYDESSVKLENTSAPIKSVGNSTTTPKDMETDEDVKIVLYILAESVAARLRENGFRCRTVEISIRDKDLFHFSKQVKLQNASNITREIAEAGYKLYKESYRLPADEKELKNSRPEFYQKPLRSIGIRGTDLVTDYFWELKKTKKGRKYYGCENNPECDFMSWSRPVEEKCPKCGGYMVMKGSKIVCADEQCGYVTEKKEKNQE